jgi:hypothetical protein
MASFDELYSRLQAMPGLSASIGIEKAMSFIRLAAQLKNEILHVQEPTYNVNEPPSSLPEHVNSFLGASTHMPKEFVLGCWEAFRDVVWSFDTEGNACRNDVDCFEDYGLKEGLCGTICTPQNYRDIADLPCSCSNILPAYNSLH